MMDSKWEARFMKMAQEVASWSRDPSTKVGCVIVRPDKTIASLGFNGFARGVEDSNERLENRDQRLLFTTHAELNAILGAREPLDGCSIFVWPMQPCAHCASAIIQSGIKTVYCPISDIRNEWADSFEAAFKMFVEAGVKFYYS